MIDTPFPFEKLKKYTAKQAELFSYLAHVFPFSGESNPKILEPLKKYLDKQLTLRFEFVFDAPFEKFVAGLPERFIVFVVSLTPSGKKIMIELDPDFSLALVDKMLGGDGSIPQEWQSITPLQEGVLKFIMARVLKEYSQDASESPFSFRLDKVLSQAPDVSRLENEGEWVILLTLRIKMGNVPGYIRFCIPHPLLTELSEEAFQFSKKEAQLSTPLEKMEHMRLPVWAELGRVTLTHTELGELRKGDIVLFDETYPDFDGEKLSGSIQLRIGDEGTGFIEGKLHSMKDSCQVLLQHVFS